MYLFRLDDASEYMDVEKWEQVFSILDRHKICPLIGIIPQCKDEEFTKKYAFNKDFWLMARAWQDRGYIIAMHGFQHVYNTHGAGLNPIHNRSEFVGLSLEEQKQKIKDAFSIFKSQNIMPKVFFAPSHTFDENTLKAIYEMTEIRVVSDTIAGNVYKKDDLFFLPCQIGKPRALPLKFVGIALHPNNMSDDDFAFLDSFLNTHSEKCIKSFDSISLLDRPYSLFDCFLRFCYFSMRKLFRKT